MKKIVTENDLRLHGFTERQIKIFQENLNRPGYEIYGFINIIDDLRKRFWCGIFFLFVILILLIVWCGDLSNYSYPVMIVVMSLGIYFTTPLLMGYKAYKMHRSLKD